MGQLSVAHGTHSTYTNRGCRCEACKSGEREYQRRYRHTARGREIVGGHKARWYAANKERWREYLVTYRATERGRLAHNARERSRRPVSPETLDYLEILARDPCCYCGAPMQEIDHIVPLAAGGAGSWGNLTAACKHCNRSKSAKALLEFL